MDKECDGDYLTYVSGTITISGVVTISSGTISGWFEGERDRTFRCYAYSSGQNVVYQNEGNRGEVGAMDMETEQGRRNIALPYEELNYYGVIKMVQSSIGNCDTGIVMLHPFGNEGKIDVLWISTLYGIIAFEDKRLKKSTTTPEKCGTTWMDERFCNRYDFVQNVFGIPIKFRVGVVTKRAWFEVLNEYLSMNKIYCIETGQMDTPEQKKLAEAEFEKGLLRILVFQDDLLECEV
jgi:hypothetical protein